jgi:hypothetical protein
MIYIVLMKEYILGEEVVSTVAAFNDYAAAKEWRDRAIDADSDCGFRIDTAQLNPTGLTAKTRRKL